MTPNLLILGGTTEATALGQRLAQTGVKATLSLAGRVKTPKAQPLPTRIGGFGGAEGLHAFLKSERVTYVIDATHPFAAQMSRNAVAACSAANVPLAALTRAPWAAQPGDTWHHVTDIDRAVAALDRPALRVFLAIGRMHLEAFAQHPQHHYLLRVVDAPETAMPFPNYDAIVDRGPFDVAADRTLLDTHRIDLVVSKNAGGSGAQAKLIAARDLGLPVIMIDRPKVPARTELHSVAAVMEWLNDHSRNRGV